MKLSLGMMRAGLLLTVLHVVHPAADACAQTVPREPDHRLSWQPTRVSGRVVSLSDRVASGLPKDPFAEDPAVRPAQAVAAPEAVVPPPPAATTASPPPAPTEPIIETVRFADVPLSEAMRLFSQQSGLNVLPSPEAATIRVSLDLHNVTPTVVLDALARTYRLVVLRDAQSGVVNLYTAKEYMEMMSQPGYRSQLQTLLRSLEKEINEAFPGSSVRLSLVGEQILVQGEAKDVIEACNILRIVAQSTPAPAKDNRPKNVSLTVQQTAVTPGGKELGVGLSGPAAETLEKLLSTLPPNIINLLKIPGEQQVMLCVTVAEVNRDAARSIGLNLRILHDGLEAPVFESMLGNASNLNALLDNGQVSLAINALRHLSLARSLAEPNLTTLNGQPASFQAGGEFPVPVVAGAAGAGLQGVAYVPFGVQLQFTPLIIDRHQIRLVVQAKVSTRSDGLGATIGGSTVPGLTSRDFQATVELEEGQTLAVAGLIQNNFGADSDRVPLWGDLPIIGRTGSYDRVSAGEQELVILITPRLVHPLDRCEMPPLPGFDIAEPNDIEFYLCGKLESNYGCDFRSAARTDWCRLRRCHNCCDPMLVGPNGYCCGGDPPPAAPE